MKVASSRSGWLGKRAVAGTLRGFVLVAVALAAACGGGGGGGSSNAPAVPPREPVATTATESQPVGATVDLAGMGYMPFVQGSSWVFAMRDANGVQTGTSTRTLTSAPAGGSGTAQFTVVEGGTTQVETYRLAPSGVYSVVDDASIPATARAVIGELREYAFPTYAAGEPRTVVRAGPWGEDLDGDGIDETFRLVYTQVYDGLVPLALPWDPAATVARFSATLKLAVTASRTGLQAGTSATTTDFFARDVGPVGGTLRMTDLAGNVLETRDLLVTTATVGGTTYKAPAVDIVHGDLVYDALRNVYYASVPSGGSQPNTIATVTPAATASFAALAGVDPGPLAISGDGQFLYVGLGGSSEVLKLALPSMTAVARIDLGPGTLVNHYAERIAVSPADPNVIAVSLRQPASPKHDGVVLVSGTTVLPVRTQTHTGSNLIAFNADGSLLYGYNNETTEFGLREIAVAADGLRETRVVATNDDFGVRRLEFSGGRIYLHARSWTTALVQAGQFGAGSASQCSPLATANRVACLPGPLSAAVVATYDAVSFAPLASIPVPQAAGTVLFGVPGPAGTLALSTGTGGTPTRIYLLRDARL